MQHSGRRHRSLAHSSRRRAERIGGLQRMPALHATAALLTLPDVDVKRADPSAAPGAGLRDAVSRPRFPRRGPRTSDTQRAAGHRASRRCEREWVAGRAAHRRGRVSARGRRGSPDGRFFEKGRGLPMTRCLNDGSPGHSQRAVVLRHIAAEQPTVYARPAGIQPAGCSHLSQCRSSAAPDPILALSYVPACRTVHLTTLPRFVSHRSYR